MVSSGVVVVKFEVQQPTNQPAGSTLPPVMIPVAWPEYIRYPVQVGDLGFCVAADAYLGGVSGIGGGVASLVQQGNLAALAFQPLGNTAWKASPDPNAVVIYGVNGHGVQILSDIVNTTVSLVLTDSGVVITGNVTVRGNLSVTGPITTQANVTAGTNTGTVELLDHVHINGDGTTGPPKPGS